MYRHTGTTQVTSRVITKVFDFGLPETILRKILTQNTHAITYETLKNTL